MLPYLLLWNEMMKKRLFQTAAILVLLGCVIIYGCITGYEQSGIEGYRDILIVEGIITNDTTIITLSKSIGINDRFSNKLFVENATLFVECEGGVSSDISQYTGNGEYLIETGTLDDGLRYRLRIFWDGKEYESNYLKPVTTPEFMTSWRLDDKGYLNVCVSTSDEQEEFRYYFWSYRENWEITANVFVDTFFFKGDTFINDLSTRHNYYRCWKEEETHNFHIASSEMFDSNTINDHSLNAFPVSDERINTLYYIAIKQNLIRKEAYRYFSNIKKNVERTGTLFSPIPLEIPGNIVCVSHPNTPVIGYVEVSTTTENQLYITREEAYVEPEYAYDCFPILDGKILVIDPEWAYIWIFIDDVRLKAWMPVACMDCTYQGPYGYKGSKEKPAWWPNDHL